MSIENQKQLEVTRGKLQLLEQRYRELQNEPVQNVDARQWTARSLKKLINQMKQEIVRFEIGSTKNNVQSTVKVR